MAASRSGRPPKPDALRALMGGKSHHKPEPPAPQPEPIAPDPPGWLDAEALAEWHRVADELEELNLLTRPDRAAYTCYCLAYSILVKAQAAIADHYARTGKLTMTYTNKAGAANEVPIPEVAIARDAMTTIRAFCVEFGLTPSSRSRMKGLGDGKKPGQLQDFLAKQKARRAADD